MPRPSTVPTCLGCHHEGRVPVLVLLVDVYVGALLQQGHDVHEALVAGDHEPVLERGQHSAPGLALHHPPHHGAPHGPPNFSPSLQTGQAQDGRRDEVLLQGLDQSQETHPLSKPSHPGLSLLHLL